MKKFQWKLPGFLESRTLPGLIGRCLGALALPYVYLLLCGLVFDKLLKWYFMTGFIFYSLLALYAAAIALVVWMILRFVKSGKRSK